MKTPVPPIRFGIQVAIPEPRETAAERMNEYTHTKHTLTHEGTFPRYHQLTKGGRIFG